MDSLTGASRNTDPRLCLPWQAPTLSTAILCPLLAVSLLFLSVPPAPAPRPTPCSHACLHDCLHDCLQTYLPGCLSALAAIIPQAGFTSRSPQTPPSPASAPEQPQATKAGHHTSRRSKANKVVSLPGSGAEAARGPKSLLERAVAPGGLVG